MLEVKHYLFKLKVLQYREKISDISALATNEATLEGMLNRIIEVWKKTDFRLVTDHGKDTFIITGTDEIQILLEESQVNNFIQKVLFSNEYLISFQLGHNVDYKIVEIRWSY